MKDLVGVEQHVVAGTAEAERDRLLRTLGHGGHGDGLEGVLDVGEHVAACGASGQRMRLQRELLAAAAGRNQAHTRLDKADVALEREHPVRGVHHELAAAAQRHALHRGHHRHLGVLDRHRGALEAGDHLLQQLELPGTAGLAHLLQVGADRERRRLPDHQAVELDLGARDRLEHAVHDLVADRMHLGRDRHDPDARVLVGAPPQAHAGVFPQRLAAIVRGLAEHAVGVELTLVHRQRRARLQGVLGGAVGAGRRMHALAREHPGRQRHVGHGAAVGDVVADHLRHRLPARRLPGLERALRPAETPAHREVDVARVVGDGAQVHRTVVEHVAEDRPQELRLRMRMRGELGELLRRALQLQDVLDVGEDLAAAVAVVLQVQVEHLDLLALLAIHAGLGLLAERALRDQRLQPRGRLEMRMPGVVGQRRLHRAEHVHQRIEADHVGGAEGGALRAADARAGEQVDLVEGQAQALRVVQHGEDREHPDAVGDEVGRIPGAHDALAQSRRQPGLERVQHRRIGVGSGDEFHQRHVARWIEKMDAAKATAPLDRHAGSQRSDGQARGVGGKHSTGLQKGGDPGVKVELPLHLLGDRLDDEVALAQPGEVAAVVGGLDVLRAILGGEGRGVELLHAGDRLVHDAVGRAFPGRQVEQDHRYVGVGAMGCDLRPHDTGAEHGDLANDQSAHLHLLMKA